MDIKWVPLVGKTGYILAAGALIPTYILNDREIVLVDSGLHYDPGLVSFIRAVGVSVYAVLQTHLHEDHVANNRILINRFGTRIIADAKEVEMVHSASNLRRDWRELRPETKDKYLRTYSYKIESIEDGQEEIVLRGIPFKIVPLYGHSEGHLGYVTPDGVLCTGDAILSPAMAQYSKMPYFEDIGKAIESLNRLLQTDYPYYALAHMEIIEKRDMPGLVKKNLALLERIHVEMLELINDPVTLDELVSSVMYGLGIRFGNETRNAYLKTTISSRVKYLVETGRLRRIEEDGVIRYGKVQRSIYGE